MSTPFAPFANLTVVFDVPTGTDTVGADGVSQRETDKQVAIAYTFQKSSSVKRVEQLVDGNEDSIVLSGNWVNPARAVRSLTSLQKGSAIVWSLGAGFSLPVSTGFTSLADYNQFQATNAAAIAMRGELLYLPSPPSPDGDEQVTGDVFNGIFVMRSAWSELA